MANANMGRLCQFCRDMFLQSYTGLNDPNRRLRRRGEDVRESANFGCQLCIIAWDHERVSLLRQELTIEEITLLCSIIYWRDEIPASRTISYWAPRDFGETGHYLLFRIKLCSESGNSFVNDYLSWL